MPRLFGTDGVRGLANAELGPDLALRLAASAARVLRPSHRGPGRPVAVVGRDPRASGEMLEAAVSAGLASAGVDVLQLGVVPTPGIAYLTGELGADLGVVISASHNPMPDNGIKIFARGGHKLEDAVEDAIEADMALPTDTAARPTGAAVGRLRPAHHEVARYVDHLVAATPHPLTGLTVVVDCANGAASDVAPLAYRRAGATVHVVAGEPDGLNINDGVGSTHLDHVRAAVVEHGADLGIAHDGDADRCLAVAADGSTVDGDAILAILAGALHGAGRLAGGTVVGTVMANLGFHKAMEAAGIAVVTTAVGDRYVLEQMRAGGYTLGGEQSGHVVLADHATTGDGVLTALQVMSRMAETGRSLAELAGVVQRFPQVLVNVRTADKSVADSPAVQDAVRAAVAELDGAGRVLLRPSGTEPVVRVMVEAPTADQAQEVADRVARVVAGTSPA
ncbi:phosphoglucosamine mutase [Nakamurella endophytica]|uniref:Phosphoglucosamine mutase n=1 Tax=Nakamurella endophytica TaxID=1748367 RepID=A0A917SZT8_9ACTN|nr:phosphoglucosamine mutase [Nakamurella endophytica]GGM03129.1 phosphoglucosamine mutase [Nakamurella endophytica]